MFNAKIQNALKIKKFNFFHGKKSIAIYCITLLKTGNFWILNKESHSKRSWTCIFFILQMR